jgi:predicted nucleic acid-binding protein
VILADTSGLLALLDEGEPRHREAREAVRSDTGPLLTIDLVLAETGFLVLSRLGAIAERAFLDQVVDGALAREPIGRSDLTRAREILEQFEDQAFDLTDAALMAVAERLSVPVLTFDRRHFGLFRDRRGNHLALLP